MTNFRTLLYTLINGRYVGKDAYGNKYYQSKTIKREFARQPRWVLYNGIPEPTKVSALWFDWLHYQSDKAPDDNYVKHAWEKETMPNLTGTKHAYYPEGHIYSGAKRAPATGDYQAWDSTK